MKKKLKVTLSSGASFDQSAHKYILLNNILMLVTNNAKLVKYEADMDYSLTSMNIFADIDWNPGFYFACKNWLDSIRKYCTPARNFDRLLSNRAILALTVLESICS